VGDPIGTIYVAGRPMYLPAGSFSQTNSQMLTVLLNRMRSAIQGRDIANAADIYGGIGTLGLQLADCVDRMALIELDGSAVEAARRTASEWGLTAIDFISRHAEKVVPEMLSLDLAIVDPPRCGLGDIVVDALAATAVPFILYVSCAPPSLARDLAQFARHDYSIETLDIFDFYPQTYHVESLVVLRK
jgi:tRNA/tmRNA/rRNA uracil-C5-methylase (TrmA/RlmC/RlmD family)